MNKPVNSGARFHVFRTFVRRHCEYAPLCILCGRPQSDTRHFLAPGPHQAAQSTHPASRFHNSSCFASTCARGSCVYRIWGSGRKASQVSPGAWAIVRGALALMQPGNRLSALPTSDSMLSGPTASVRVASSRHQAVYRFARNIFAAFSPPLRRCTSGEGRSTPGINVGLSVHGVTLRTLVRSIQCWSLAGGRSHVMWK